MRDYWRLFRRLVQVVWLMLVLVAATLEHIHRAHQRRRDRRAVKRMVRGWA